MVVEIDWIVGDVSLCMAVIEVQLLADPFAFEALKRSTTALSEQSPRRLVLWIVLRARSSAKKRVLVYWQ